MFLPKPGGNAILERFPFWPGGCFIRGTFYLMIIRSRMRVSPDLRSTALFLLAVIALAVVGAVTVAGGRAYVDAVHHIESLALPDVHGDVSSTIDGAQRDAGLTMLRLRERVATLNAEREAA